MARSRNAATGREPRAQLPNSYWREVYYVNGEDDVLLVAIYSKSEQADIEAEDMLRIIRDEECS